MHGNGFSRRKVCYSIFVPESHLLVLRSICEAGNDLRARMKRVPKRAFDTINREDEPQLAAKCADVDFRAGQQRVILATRDAGWILQHVAPEGPDALENRKTGCRMCLFPIHP